MKFVSWPKLFESLQDVTWAQIGIVVLPPDRERGPAPKPHPGRRTVILCRKASSWPHVVRELAEAIRITAVCRVGPDRDRGLAPPLVSLSHTPGAGEGSGYMAGALLVQRGIQDSEIQTFESACIGCSAVRCGAARPHGDGRATEPAAADLRSDRCTACDGAGQTPGPHPSRLSPIGKEPARSSLPARSSPIVACTTASR
jgi:hypothetical protein